MVVPFILGSLPYSEDLAPQNFVWLRQTFGFLFRDDQIIILCPNHSPVNSSPVSFSETLPFRGAGGVFTHADIYQITSNTPIELRSQAQTPVWLVLKGRVRKQNETALPPKGV